MNPWEQHWGREYDKGPKREFLLPILSNLESRGKIGEVVVDVGSGLSSVANNLTGNHKLITLDIAGKESEDEKRKHMRVNVENILDKSKLSYKKALIKAANFLDINLRQETNKEQTDSIIFSEILNYVDYQEILRAFAKYLKSEGRFIIVNMPGRGIEELFSEKGLKSNEELYKFLEQEGFEIEEKHFPWKLRKSPEEDQELLVLIARKKSKDETSKDRPC